MHIDTLLEQLYQKNWNFLSSAEGINYFLKRNGQILRLYINNDCTLREISIEDDENNARIPAIQDLDKLVSNICFWKSNSKKKKLKDFYNSNC